MIADYKRCTDCNREMELIKISSCKFWSCECGKEINYAKRGKDE